ALDDLMKHLANLIHEYKLDVWYDERVHPGEDWDEAINAKLDEAQLILLLISDWFLQSRSCQIELERALAAGVKRIVPILLRDCSWEKSEIKKLQMIPRKN